MPFSVELGLLLALATAFVSVLGFLYKHRGAVAAPPVRWRHPFASMAALLSNRWFMLGMVVATASWGFHVAALSLAPISLVQSVIAGGLVLLTVLAERMFGIEVTRREWIGVGMTAAGLAFLAATLGSTGREKHSDYETATLVAWVGSLAVVSVVPMLLAMRDAARAGILLGVAAGLQWGASDVTIKAASDHLSSDGILVLVSPLAATIAILSLIGLVVSARSLQLGQAVAVIAVTSAAANLVTIASGLIVFGEPLPDGSLAIAVRMTAFVCVIFAAALTPAPVALAELAAGGEQTGDLVQLGLDRAEPRLDAGVREPLVEPVDAVLDRFEALRDRAQPAGQALDVGSGRDVQRAHRSLLCLYGALACFERAGDRPRDEGIVHQVLGDLADRVLAGLRHAVAHLVITLLVAHRVEG